MNTRLYWVQLLCLDPSQYNREHHALGMPEDPRAGGSLTLHLPIFGRSPDLLEQPKPPHLGGLQKVCTEFSGMSCYQLQLLTNVMMDGESIFHLTI